MAHPDTAESVRMNHYAPTGYGPIASAGDRYLTAAPDSITAYLLDLSKAAKLKEAWFQCDKPNVEWITSTLRTIKSTGPQWAKINISSHRTFNDPIEETTRQEWEDLDHLLDGLWTSRLVYPEVVYTAWQGIDASVGERVRGFLLKPTSRGAIYGENYQKSEQWNYGNRS
jgi:hypothetical protein